MSQAVRAVVFDVGETLTNDNTFWESWAQWLGVPCHTLSALVGHVTAEGRDNADALKLIKPGFDLVAERAAREAAGHGEKIRESDLYPDVRPALAAIRATGRWVGVAGNQTRRAGELLRALDLPTDAIATSDEWGIAKPDPRFFKEICRWSGFPADQILYVGDHPDNDVLPANAAGLHTAHLRRGPWGYRHADDARVHAAADWRVDSLLDLLAALQAHR